MRFTSKKLPILIMAAAEIIEQNKEQVTLLDQAIGDGDHVINLQRGIDALIQQCDDLATLEWAQALQKIGMILLSTMGGASGSLFGTLFISMGKAASGEEMKDRQGFADVFKLGVEAVKKRGKADAGEKTMLDVLIPVSDYINQEAQTAIDLSYYLGNICQIANDGVESTLDMLATKGRASYLGDKSIGHIDAGAKTSQLMICAIVGACVDIEKSDG